VVNAELALVMIVGDGVVDDVLQATVISNLWSATSISSSNGDEVRLGTTTASVVVGELEKLQEKAGQRCHSTCQKEGRRLGGSRGKGEASLRGYRQNSAACLHGLRRGIPLAWQLRVERGREEKGEGVLGFIGTVLMAS
jgi:hypothetical protein